MYFNVGSHTQTIRVENWSDAVSIAKNLDRWLFRGQKCADWSLKTSVERAFEFRNLDLKYLTTFEQISLIDFKKIAHNFSEKIPGDDDLISWLALIQHYGGPTRLLDFTESFYIAVYFALKNSTKSCAVWGINRPKLMERLPKIIKTVLSSLLPKTQVDPLPSEFLNVLIQSAINSDIKEKFIFTAAPKRLNERQYMQQGLSVIPSNLGNGFMDTLLNSFGETCFMPKEIGFNKLNEKEPFSNLDEIYVIKIIIDQKCFLDARRELNKMSINSLSLFRGLDGLGSTYTIF